MNKEEFIKKCEDLITDKNMLILMQIIAIGMPDDFDFTEQYEKLKGSDSNE